MARTVALLSLTLAALGCGVSRSPAASSQATADAAVIDAAPHISDAGADAEPGPASEDATMPDAEPAPSDGSADAEPTTPPPAMTAESLPPPQPSAAGELAACAFEPASRAPVDAGDACPGGVYRGDLLIQNPEDANAVAGCTRIEGDVTVVSGETAFANFDRVRVITGDLRIVSAPVLCGGAKSPTPCGPAGGWNVSLTPLRSLHCVGGDLLIGIPEVPLANDLSPLGSLIEVGGALRIASNAHHQRPPFAMLRRVWGTIEVPDLSWLAVLETAYGRLTMRPPGAKWITAVGKSAVPSLRYLGCGVEDPPCVEGVLGCSIEVTTNAALQVFRSCSVVLGDVKLLGPNVTDVSDLAALRRVKGALWLTITHVPDLNAFANVDRVDELRLDTNLYLADVSGVEGIAVRSIKVYDNAELRGLGAWRSMRPIGDIDVFVETNPLLETVGDWPWLVRANSLHLGGDGLTSLGRFDMLTRVRRLELNAAKLVTAGDAFPSLESVDELAITNSSALRSPPMFPRSNSRLSRLEVIASGVIDLRGLERIVDIGWATISDNPALISLSGFGAVKSIGRFQLERNPMLRTLRDLNGLTSATELYIHGNPSLPDCEAEWLAERTNQPAGWTSSDNGGGGPCAMP